MEGAYTSEGFGGRVPQNLSPWLGRLRDKRLGVNLEVVVPDWLSDLTDCHRPDGRYVQRRGKREKESGDSQENERRRPREKQKVKM
ncbi:hypothetical protein EYF80_023656 [Liparis tanakae]|uniref:Uncharacterized protein n=1 Tax=Liparis tanakae TaxID=230148 RepID=A0A4Z2HK36_9TELE|nr:hypothetical protein EYF80_023656 [Liparis tanakae]